MKEQDSQHDCLVAFGSNLGDPMLIYEQTREMLVERFGTGLRSSNLRKTKPVGGPSGQREYLNGVFRFPTRLSPFEVHDQLLQVESAMGRVRQQRWGARTVDLDLLLFGKEIIESDRLTVPHPRMSVRKFVLQPAVEIAADMRHPLCSRSLGEILRHLNETGDEIVWVTDDDAFSNQCRDTVLSSIAPKNVEFHFHLTHEPVQFERLKRSARFVVWTNPRPGNMRGEKFDGPQFEVSLIDISNHGGEKVLLRRPISDIAAEIAAAIQSSS